MFFFTKSVMSRMLPFVDGLADVLGVQDRHVEVRLVRRELREDRVVPLRVRHGVDLDGHVRPRPSCTPCRSSSSACAGGHSNHRNVSVIGSSDSLLVRQARPSWPRLHRCHCRSAAGDERSAAAAATIRRRDLEVSPSFTPPPTRVGPAPTAGGTCEPCTRLAKNLRCLLHSLSTFCNFLHSLSSSRYCPAHGIATESTGTSTCSIPPTGPVIESLALRHGRRTGSPRSTPRQARRRRLGRARRRASAPRSSAVRST